MAKKTTTGQYDRVFKENAEEIYASLIKALLHIEPDAVQDLPQSDLQRTIERKADFLKKVFGTNGSEDYALHIEIQSTNDKTMHKRMLLYHALIYDTYNLDSQHFIIYVGNEDLAMPAHISHKNLQFSYEIIDIRRYDYEVFLRAITPEEVVLAILGNFHQEQPAIVIEQILQRLQSLAPTELAFGKYASQLEIIAQLRNLQKETLTRIKTMPIVFDLTQTLAYEQGEAKGEAKGEARGEAKIMSANIKSLLTRGKLNPTQIADILDVPIDLVLEIEKSINKTK